MTKEELLLKKRLVELSNIAFNRNIPVFTDFLNLNELNILYSVRNELYTSEFKAYGGYESAERQMVAFIPDAFCCDIKELFPMMVVKVTPLSKKYSDALSHRDFLGAIINLGIDRSKIGDILVKENEGFIFCSEKLGDYLIEQLTRIKHTSVNAVATKLMDFVYEPEFKTMKGSISTARIDSVLTVCCGGSRSEAVEYIMAKKVFINGRLIEANSVILKSNDVISIRGVGKFIYTGVLSETKKGRIYVELKKYI